ncbi:MBL fold metallo-hydrolase [Nocardioides daeguensis]|uniref:MBL fold metallo-hydrolase n=1 Tax=Nocardioides daeguensis TaxID=908359 RepID=A0ABP6V3F5_9ACTN|nr:MBL fold metallo-hydrolase [Nocardioides daeguensis]MBV6727125.1 MBL fold metallo-hydrolase [Nocardioides daeguensis]MCR1771472.1 MBL fold metallo-hydrolase [Nocardioides daeguensis]
MLLTDQPEVTFHWLRVGHCKGPEAMARQGGRLRIIEFPSYVGALHHPEHGWTLFDTGYSQHFLDATSRLPELLYRNTLPVTLRPEEHLPRQLAALDIDPGDVRRIVVSHFHGDHVGGLLDHPRARIIAGASGAEHALSLRGINAVRHAILPALLPGDLRDRLDPVDGFAQVSVGGLRTWDLLGDRSLLAVDLPGHMPGHLGLLFTSGGRQVLLVGDAAWTSRSFRDLRPPSRLAKGVMHDWDSTVRTLGVLHALDAAHDDLLILPAHCPEGHAAWSTGA